VKPGIQTTEFWLSAFTTVASLLVLLGVPQGLNDAQLRTLAGAAAIVVPAVYSLARSLVKWHAAAPHTEGAGLPQLRLVPPAQA
jgi:hypothetical protein